MNEVFMIRWLFVFLFDCVYIGIASSLADESPIVDFAPRRIRPFTSLASVQVFHWALTPEYKKYVFRFEGFVKKTGSGFGIECQDGITHIIIRSHAVPIPNPRRWKLSPNVILHQDTGVVYFGQLLLSEKLGVVSRNVTLAFKFKNAAHYFVSLYLSPSFNDESVSGLTQQCQFEMGLKIAATNVSENNNSVCFSPKAALGLQLTRYQRSLFNVKYILDSSENMFNISFNSSRLFQWRLLPVTDSGGTLRISLKTFPILDVQSTNSSSIVLVGNLRHPLMKDSTNFTGDVVLLANPTAGNRSTWDIPFPLSGIWGIELSLICTTNYCPNVTQLVEMHVGVGYCVNDCFSAFGQGFCSYYTFDKLFVAACTCFIGWQGIDCNDGAKVLSFDTQLLQTMLLTLSNIAFVPGIVLAFIHRYYIEAFLYTVLCFFSVFYHACDQSGNVKFCILPYETLQFADFFYAISSLWFTLLSIADLGQKLETFFQVSGILIFSAAISYNRFSSLSFTIPFVVGVLIVIFQWGRKSKALQTFYPGSKKFLYFILPALLCTGFSIYLNVFVKTSKNYFIVHSIWHLLLGGAIFFLLLLKSALVKDISSTVNMCAVVESNDTIQQTPSVQPEF